MPNRLAPPGERRDCRCPRANHQHGTYGAYHRDGCRCDPCRAASRQARADSNRRAAYRSWSGETLYVSPLGSRRRLQALAAIGWTAADLGNRLGVSMQAAAQFRDDDRPAMLAATAAKIAALYDELSLTVPTGGYHQRARNIARRHKWAPPLAWDDDTIDDPNARPQGRLRNIASSIDRTAVAEALTGRPVKLNRAERAEAVRLATERGLSAAEIAERLGTTPRTVQRKREQVAA